MPERALLFTTGNAGADRAIRGLIDLFEATLPGRVRGYYLQGSYADGTAVPTSDVDLRVVFKGKLGAKNRDLAVAIAEALEHITLDGVDTGLDDEDDLFRVGAVRFRAAQLVYGEDIRSRVPLKPLDEYTRDLMHVPFRLLTRARGNCDVLDMPLDFPDPLGQFRGYDHRTLIGPGHTVERSTKGLTLIVLVSASALLAYDAGRYVVSKRDCVAQYPISIGDEWTALVQAIDARCRGAWHYRIPDDEDERAELRALCEQTLAFENYFLGRYLEFLESESRHPDASVRRRAAERRERIRD